MRCTAEPYVLLTPRLASSSIIQAADSRATCLRKQVSRFKHSLTLIWAAISDDVKGTRAQCMAVSASGSRLSFWLQMAALSLKLEQLSAEQWNRDQMSKKLVRNVPELDQWRQSSGRLMPDQNVGSPKASQVGT